MIVIRITSGSLLDTDALAHRMWARQLLETGRIVVTSNGLFDDASIYYPNTVMKPVSLVLALTGEIAGGPAPDLIALCIGIAILLTAGLLVDRLTGNSRPATWLVMLLLGFNPVYVSAVLGGNPSILLLGMLLLIQFNGGRRNLFPALAAALVRPEGFIYSCWHFTRSKRYGLIPFLLVPAAIWLLLNRLTAGSWLWSAQEVRYVVSAMSYPTPGVISFWPWAMLRGFLTVGPLLCAVFILRERPKWPWSIPVLLNLLILDISLAAGSLVLSRYLDHIFLLLIPWAVAALFNLMDEGASRRAAVALSFAGSLLLWPATLRDMSTSRDIAGELARIGRQGWAGRLAVNELLVPGIALESGISDPRYRFLSIDRAAWESLSEDALVELGVDRILLIEHPLYLPDHTRDYLNTISGIDVDTLPAGER